MNGKINFKLFRVALVAIAFVALAAPVATFAAPVRGGTPALSASAAAPSDFVQMGKLSIAVQDARAGIAAQPAAILVFDGKGMVVAKGLTNADGYWATMLPVGQYKVAVTLSSYLDYRAIVNVYANQTTTLNVTFGIAPANL